jgi:REP element-mobilizing transposase RayT
MSVRRLHDQTDGLYFITFTCVNYLPLFEETQLYSFICEQFRLLNHEGYKICGFVIMPNHVHFLLYVPLEANINRRIGAMKRFTSYEIVKRLKALSFSNRLEFMHNQVNNTDRRRGKQHDVFEPSFDARICLSRDMADQKLKYMHDNPCSGKWNLVQDYTQYTWSSAHYYEHGEKDPFDFLVRYEEYV